MKDVNKKFIAPVVVVIIVLIIIFSYAFGVYMATGGVGMSRILGYLMIAGLAALGIGLIWVLFKRYKEMKEDEEDDISQY